MIYLDGESLTLEQTVAVAREGATVEVSPEGKEKINASRAQVEKFIADGNVIYGLNTGFGSLCNVAVSDEELVDLQVRLIYSDCCGVGKPFDTEVVRVIMLLRVNALAKGFSGIRLSVVQTLVDMLNAGVHPIIPEKGSVGASGDLCPLAHMALVMMGEGEAEYKGTVMPGGQALAKAGIAPIALRAKEGLALINGTCAMMGPAALAVYDANILAKTADVVGTLTMETLSGIVDAYDLRLHKARNQKGQVAVAENVLKLCQGSGLTTKQGEKRVQDAYSLRCIPQIHGASRPALQYITEVIEAELNAATDNPLIFAGDKASVISGGNFHGQPVAIAMDTLAIAMAEYANVSERRIERLLNPALSGLPAFLTEKGGVNCGFMIPQYAAAALVSENKVLAHPASVDSIPTCANQEDHVSMGTIAARKAREVLKHVQQVLGIELLCASQAADFTDPAKLGAGSQTAYKTLRNKVSYMASDRVLYPDMAAAAQLVADGSVLAAAEAAVGKLN